MTEKRGVDGPDEDGSDKLGITRRSTIGAMGGLAGLGVLSERMAVQDGGDDRSWHEWEGDADAQEHALRALGKLGMAESSTAITDFEGEHLAVDEDGRLHARSAVSYHDIDEYGADPTGEEPSDEAFDAAVDAAADHDVVAMTSGTYYFTDEHTLRKPVTLVGSGSRIESDVNQKAHRDDQRPGRQLFTFKGEGPVEATSLTTSATEGEDQIEVIDPSIFGVGDFVRVTNHESRASREYEPSFSKVRGTDGDTLVLAGNLRYDHYQGQPVERMSMLERPGMVDVHVRPREEPYFDERLEKVLGGPERVVVTEHCYGFVMRECSFEHYDQHAWLPVDDFKSAAINCRASFPMNKHGSHGEPFLVSGSNDITFINPTVEECRRGIDLRSGCKDLVIINPKITGAMAYGLSFHHNRSSSVRGNMIVIGGYVAAHSSPDPTLHSSESADAGYAVTAPRTDDSRIELYGVELRGTVQVARIEGTKQFKAVGCTFGAIPQSTWPGTSIISVRDGAGSRSENVSFVDCTIETPDRGSFRTNAVDVESARNLSLDVELRGPFDAGITIEEAGWLDVDVTANAPDGTCTITIGDGVENARITGHLRQGAGGIEVTGECENIHVRDFITAGGPTVTVDASDGNVANLRLQGVVAADGGVMDFNETLIDGLWIRDCQVGEIRNLHSGQHEEFTVIDGNREIDTGDWSVLSDDPARE